MKACVCTHQHTRGPPDHAWYANTKCRSGVLTWTGEQISSAGPYWIKKSPTQAFPGRQSAMEVSPAEVVREGGESSSALTFGEVVIPL